MSKSNNMKIAKYRNDYIRESNEMSSDILNISGEINVLEKYNKNNYL